MIKYLLQLKFKHVILVYYLRFEYDNKHLFYKNLTFVNILK